jgi:hypothetical protein
MLTHALGVGGWGDIGVDPALYSRSLMEGAKLSAETPLSPRDPVEIMSEGYQYSTYVQGSSTCCILVLDGQLLRAANLGDSGFMVIRGLDIVYRTKEQQHSFNFPYQIGTGSADKPQHAQRITVEVQPDDLIILGTVCFLPPLITSLLTHTIPCPAPFLVLALILIVVTGRLMGQLIRRGHHRSGSQCPIRPSNDSPAHREASTYRGQ